jgi:hypothetical protein
LPDDGIKLVGNSSDSGGAMGTRNGNLAGWILAVAALFILAAEGNFGLLAVLVPVSFLLAWVMIGPASDGTQLTQNREKQ